VSINPAALAAEIANDPLGLGYANQGDAAVCSLLNAAHDGYTASNPLVPLSTLAIWAAKTGVRAKIEAAAADANSAVRAPCLALRDLFAGLSGPAFDTGNADNLAMADALVSAGVLVDGSNNSLKAALVALGNKGPASRAEVLFGAGTVITPEDIRRALGRSA
jgi:hypothetical protein